MGSGIAQVSKIIQSCYDHNAFWTEISKTQYDNLHFKGHRNHPIDFVTKSTHTHAHEILIYNRTNQKYMI